MCPVMDVIVVEYHDVVDISGHGTWPLLDGSYLAYCCFLSLSIPHACRQGIAGVLDSTFASCCSFSL